MYKLLILPGKSTMDYYKEAVERHCSVRQDAGFDLIIPEDIEIPPYAEPSGKYSTLIPLDIRVRMLGTSPGNLDPVACRVETRSSTSKTPVRLSITSGIIDSGYTGELFAAFDNISESSYFIKKGTRLLQIVRGDLNYFETEIVDSFPETLRGEGKFGSTGK